MKNKEWEVNNFHRRDLSLISCRL